jgi:hypothetical protein
MLGCQPLVDLGVLMGRVVVAQDRQLGAGVGGGYLLEELQEFLVAVPGIAGVGHLAGGGVAGGEQAGDAHAGYSRGSAVRGTP